MTRPSRAKSSQPSTPLVSNNLVLILVLRLWCLARRPLHVVCAKTSSSVVCRCVCLAVQVKVGICIWLAKFLRMSRPDQTARRADPSDVPSRRYSTLTPTSGGSCTSTRRQLPSTSASNKKSSSSSSSKKNDIFQQRSSRSLLANVLDLEDDFLLLNLTPAGGGPRPRGVHVPTSVELPSLMTTPISPITPHDKVDCGMEVDDGLDDEYPPPPPPPHGTDPTPRGRLNGIPGYVPLDGRAPMSAAWPVDDYHSDA